MPIGEVLEVLKTDRAAGISDEEVEARLKIFGPNVLVKEKRIGLPMIFLRQFKSPLILMLVFAGVITVLISHYRDALFIFAAVLVNATLSFYQENKAEQALAQLKTYFRPRVRVIRGGQEKEIDAEGLVPGDVIKFYQGDRIPADARLSFVNDVQVDESILTGESLPVLKSSEPVDFHAAVGDRSSMVFAGTLVMQGVGEAIVCATGGATEVGKIAALVAKSREEDTPLQAAIRRFSLRAGIFLVILTVLIFILGVLYGQSPLEMFITSVAIAVAAVPEGLPVALTVILAVGVQRMAARKGVVRELLAAETLGSTTIVLTDKTGTLTLAQMELSRIIPLKDLDEREVLQYALIVSDVLIENPSHPPAEWKMSGPPLERCIVRAAAARGLLFPEIKKQIPILSFMPFNAVNKFSAALVHYRGRHRLVFHGAPDVLLQHTDLGKGDKEKLFAEIDALARGGERVLGIAIKDITAKKDFTFSKDLRLSGLKLIALLTFSDPIRPPVKDAIRQMKDAGVKTVIVTGDHRGTAEAVARELGFAIGPDSTIDASELSLLHQDALKKQLPRVSIFARISPEDKVRIIKAFQESGDVVAMIGDGINDAPSIKHADIGIAMGSGTEVARSVADLVLLDNNFETIVAAIEEGRQIMSNIRKTIIYLLSDAADVLLLIGGALITGVPLPLNALQILWVNFFSDSFPAIALAFEKDIDGLMARPINIKAGLFDPLMKFLIVVIGISTSFLLFILYWGLLRLGFDEALVRTFIFASFGTYTLFLAFSVRSLGKSIFSYPPFSNIYLVAGTLVGFFLTLAAVYLPFLQELFGTVPLPASWLVGVIAIGFANIAAIELGKWLFWKNNRNR